MGKNIKERAEKIARKTVNNTVGKLIPKMTLKQQVGLTRVYMQQYGIANTRRDIINGIEEEFQDEKKKNPAITTDELLKKYIECPEFMQLWEEWGLNETNLRVLAESK
jgi:hypothetical protein